MSWKKKNRGVITLLLLFILASILYLCWLVKGFQYPPDLTLYNKHIEALCKAEVIDVISWLNALGRLDMINLSLIYVALLLAIGGFGIFSILIPISTYNAEKQANKVAKKIAEDKVKEYLVSKKGKDTFKKALLELLQSAEGAEILKSTVQDGLTTLGQNENIDINDLVQNIEPKNE